VLELVVVLEPPAPPFPAEPVVVLVVLVAEVVGPLVGPVVVGAPPVEPVVDAPEPLLPPLPMSVDEPVVVPTVTCVPKPPSNASASSGSPSAQAKVSADEMNQARRISEGARDDIEMLPLPMRAGAYRLQEKRRFQPRRILLILVARSRGRLR
jgi:hypothetical protein